jgi:hypothetical protein
MIQPALGLQCVVCTVFHDPPLVKGHDTIGVFHRPHPIMPPVEGLGVDAVQVLHAPDEIPCPGYGRRARSLTPNYDWAVAASDGM